MVFGKISKSVPILVLSEYYSTSLQHWKKNHIKVISCYDDNNSYCRSNSANLTLSKSWAGVHSVSE